MTTIDEARSGIEVYRESLRGAMGATQDEWLAGYTGPLQTGCPIYGTFTEPIEGEPMLARFTNGQKWSDIMAVQHLAPGVYMNCIGGRVFDWDDDLVVAYSALSRQGGSWYIEGLADGT